MDATDNVRRIAWALFWKTILGGIVLGAIAGFLIAAFFTPLLFGFGFSEAASIKYSMYLSYAVSIICYFFVFNLVLKNSVGNNIAGKKIAILPFNELSEMSHAN